MPCTENSNSNSQPLSPIFQSALSSPTLSYAPSRSTSGSSGSDSWTSTPLTPQSPLPVVKGEGAGRKEVISPDTIMQHYMNVARRLTENRQSRATSPRPSLMSVNLSPKEVEAILAGDPAMTQVQTPPAQSEPAALDWPPHWTLGGTMTLDELPDSELWNLPEYQLTQEWFEQIIQSSNELEERRVEEERIEKEVDGGAEMDIDVETEMVSVTPRGVTRSRKQLDS